MLLGKFSELKFLGIFGPPKLQNFEKMVKNGNFLTLRSKKWAKKKFGQKTEILGAIYCFFNKILTKKNPAILIKIG